jgi:hypothetical protein
MLLGLQSEYWYSVYVTLWLHYLKPYQQVLKQICCEIREFLFSNDESKNEVVVVIKLCFFFRTIYEFQLLWIFFSNRKSIGLNMFSFAPSLQTEFKDCNFRTTVIKVDVRLNSIFRTFRRGIIAYSREHVITQYFGILTVMT